MSGEELAGRVNAAIQGSSMVRAKLVSHAAGSGKEVFQLRVKQRRNRSSADIAYEVLWPKERQGETIILRQSGGKPTGFVVKKPNEVKPIKDMDGGLLGSDLSYRDAIENPFSWKDQEVVGSETVNGVKCLILESKGGGSSYSKVRSWIDARRFIPMRIEKYSKSGQLERRIDTTLVTHDRRRPIPTNLIIRAPAQGTHTEIEGSRIDQDAKFSDSDFTP